VNTGLASQIPAKSIIMSTLSFILAILGGAIPIVYSDILISS